MKTKYIIQPSMVFAKAFSMVAPELWNNIFRNILLDATSRNQVKTILFP